MKSTLQTLFSLIIIHFLTLSSPIDDNREKFHFHFFNQFGNFKYAFFDEDRKWTILESASHHLFCLRRALCIPDSPDLGIYKKDLEKV
jgi:hypothetical protein